jgi:hypothetical protein
MKYILLLFSTSNDEAVFFAYSSCSGRKVAPFRCQEVDYELNPAFCSRRPPRYPPRNRPSCHLNC